MSFLNIIRTISVRYLTMVFTTGTLILFVLFVASRSFAANQKPDPSEPGEKIFIRNENYLLPYDTADQSNLALLKLGEHDQDPLLECIRELHPIDDYSFSNRDGFIAASSLAKSLKKKYDKVIISFVKTNKEDKNYLSPASLSLLHQLQDEMRTTVLAFGLREKDWSNFRYSPSIVATSGTDSLTLRKIGGMIFDHSLGNQPGKQISKRSVFGYPIADVPFADPADLGIDVSYFSKIDSLAIEGIIEKAYPGATILGMKNGKIFYQRAFGTFGYDDATPVTANTIFDMASCTKICATMMATMKLYDEKKIDLNKTLGDYLPWLKNTDKADITIKDMLLHQAGFIPDFKYEDFMMLDEKLPDPNIFQIKRDTLFSERVAEDMYMNKHYKDSMNIRIRDSKLGLKEYVYSDIDLQLMAYIVERITKEPIDQYVKQNFYDPMGLVSTGYNPRKRSPLNQIAPTEDEQIFRLQHLHGDVHDPRAAMFNGVAGHAGLFSDAYDLAALMSMMMNGGKFGGKQYIKPATIKLFTSYQSNISRRGIGFDKPSKERSLSTSSPYPSRYASPATYGHTGYTGTCIWADPEHDFVYIFLSNRVNPEGGKNLKLYQLEIRSKIQDLFYNAIGVGVDSGKK